MEKRPWYNLSQYPVIFIEGLLSTDELIPARNASLEAIYGSASGSNVRYYPT
jgi:hypothetical protein